MINVRALIVTVLVTVSLPPFHAQADQSVQPSHHPMPSILSAPRYALDDQSAFSQLRLAPSILTVSQNFDVVGLSSDGPVDTAWLDDPSSNLFDLPADRGTLHSQLYGAGGATGGYAEQAFDNFPGTYAYAVDTWLGTLYASAADADAMIAHTVARVQTAGYSSVPCTAPNCHAFDVTWSDVRHDSHDMLYGVEGVGQAVGEFAIDAYADDAAASHASMASWFASLAAGAHATLGGASSTVPSTATGVPILAGANVWMGEPYLHLMRETNGAPESLDFSNVAYLTGREYVTIGADVANTRSFPASARVSVIRGNQVFITRTMTAQGRSPFLTFETELPITKKSLLGALTVNVTLSLADIEKVVTQTLTVKRLTCKPGRVVKNGRCVK